MGSTTAQGSITLPCRRIEMMLPSPQEKEIGTSKFDPLSPLNTQPMVSPVNASPAPSRVPAHHSGPERLASPYSVEDFNLLSFASFAWRTAPDRIHEPMKRVGRRGSGEWETIGWDQAIDEIAAKLDAIAGNFGPEAVAHGIGTLHGSDYGIGTRFMNLFGSPNTVGQDKICLGPTAMGEFLTYGYGPTTYAPTVPGITGCLVLWGKRPSHSGKPAWRDMEKALEAGTRLLVIDPERTLEAEKADLWLQVRPGTDAALGMALLNAVIEGAHCDAEFVAAETIGFEALSKRAREYPLDKVSDYTGVSMESIKAAAEMVSAQSPTVFAGGNGLCQSGSTAVQQGRILACLIAITGNLGREGGHPMFGPPRDILGNGDWMALEAISEVQRAKTLGRKSMGALVQVMNKWTRPSVGHGTVNTVSRTGSAARTSQRCGGRSLKPSRTP